MFHPDILSYFVDTQTYNMDRWTGAKTLSWSIAHHGEGKRKKTVMEDCLVSTQVCRYWVVVMVNYLIAETTSAHNYPKLLCFEVVSTSS